MFKINLIGYFFFFFLRNTNGNNLLRPQIIVNQERETLSLRVESLIRDEEENLYIRGHKMKPPAYNAEEVQQISQEQGERNVAMAVCVQLAGRAIIRVVSRCEQAQDNCDLGKRERENNPFSNHQKLNSIIQFR